MNVTYFPGCTLRTKAKDLDTWARASAKALGIELIEPDNWQCCGGVFSYAKDEIASKLPSVRALIAARDAGQPLVTVCSACHNVIKQTNHQMQTDPDFALRVNNYLAQDKEPTSYAGETKVLHFLELLRDTVGFDELKKKVVNPLTGKKIAAYYGCLLLRPGKTMQFDDPENPTIIEDFIRAIGAEPVIYPARNECCGGYVALEDPASAKKKSSAVSASAASHGADMIVTACPLCRYNLIKNGSELPVAYFTEILAEALGCKSSASAAESLGVKEAAK
ncbi:MAG: CoB--CoM heterodisulfide reductase iron-sulfur subunit B family protein [Clostridia bacterium]|nr:CoB--CoM heterodisulfide reductase iron-sulfur subunit B family protein [Clostridia bacterium]